MPKSPKVIRRRLPLLYRLQGENPDVAYSDRGPEFIWRDQYTNYQACFPGMLPDFDELPTLEARITEYSTDSLGDELTKFYRCPGGHIHAANGEILTATRLKYAVPTLQMHLMWRTKDGKVHTAHGYADEEQYRAFEAANPGKVLPFESLPEF